MLNLLWQNFNSEASYAFGQDFIVVNGQILKNNQVIWSQLHWSNPSSNLIQSVRGFSEQSFKAHQKTKILQSWANKTNWNGLLFMIVRAQVRAPKPAFCSNFDHKFVGPGPTFSERPDWYILNINSYLQLVINRDLQSDQIRRFLKNFCKKLCYKSSPNNLCILGYFQTNIFLCKNLLWLLFWATIVNNLAAFHSNIWSHGRPLSVLPSEASNDDAAAKWRWLKNILNVFFIAGLIFISLFCQTNCSGKIVQANHCEKLSIYQVSGEGIRTH